jgi:hypothetical protein
MSIGFAHDISRNPHLSLCSNAFQRLRNIPARLRHHIDGLVSFSDREGCGTRQRSRFGFPGRVGSHILWLAPAPGQAKFFRAISSRPGEPARNLSRAQVIAIRQQVQAGQRSLADDFSPGDANTAETVTMISPAVAAAAAAAAALPARDSFADPQ